jgi:serine/threonine protein kinase
MEPRRVLHYQFLEKIGAGGMGEVYKAQDTRLNRFVAIKILHEGKNADPVRRRRFFQEAQAASALNHPNIITIHDVVSDGEDPCIVLEYVEGKTLAELIPNGGLRTAQVLLFGSQIAAALSAAHAAGIVHRDLKPGNIMVTSAGLVKVLDFGLAKLIQTTPISDSDETVEMGPPDLTVEGSMVGTVSYMSPEQAQGRRVDARSDIFSFGVVLYEMVTGRRAFDGDSAISTLSAVLRDEVSPVSGIVPQTPLQLQQIVDKCLRKDPEARYQSMKQIETELAALKSMSDSGTLLVPQAPAVKKGSPSPSPAKAPAKAKTKAIGLGVAGVIAVVGAGSWWWLAHRDVEKPPVAAVAPEVSAPTPAPVPIPTPAPADSPLTNDSVLEMVQAKAPVSVIINHIRSSKTNFTLSTPEVIRLVKGGVPESVIEAMRNPTRTPRPAPSATPVASTPTSAVPVAATPAATPAPTPLAPATPAVATIPIKAADGLPFRITLAEDIPADAEVGQPLHFTVADALTVGGSVIIAKSTAVTGAVVEAAKKKLLTKGKLTFRLGVVSGIDGKPINVRATPKRPSAGVSRRPAVTGVGSRPKDLAAAKGMEYIGYIDGDQTVTTHK